MLNSTVDILLSKQVN